jgi:predicted phosphoadenosine phosphosulfate sulfurtransferase
MKQIGVCGDNCSVCPRYIVTQSGNKELLKKVAEMWRRTGLRDTVVSPDEMICHGCAPVKWCRYNSIRKCASKKAIDNCGKCENYPCEKMIKVFEQTKSYARICKGKLSKEDYECFRKAFFSKRQNLDRVHKEYKSQRKI